jgi:glutamate racemase
MGDPRPIGMFDSGAGGLTVARAVLDALPAERLLYVADTARLPYGPRPAAEVRGFAVELAGRLLDRGAKLVVVACNSADSVALDTLAATLPVPVVGVVAPTAAAAATATRTGVVGLIGTEMTVGSGSYEAALAGTGVELHAAACPELGVLVHTGTPAEELRAVIRRRVVPLAGYGIDTLVLGCTAYPLAERRLADELGDQITLVSSAEPVAAAVRAALEADGLLAAPLPSPVPSEIMVTGDPAAFERLTAVLGPHVATVGALDAGVRAG